jgi:predicted transcriptional regulator
MNIKAQRNELGVSQYKVASLADISRFRLSLHERGEEELTPTELSRVREALRQEARRIQGVGAAVISA